MSIKRAELFDESVVMAALHGAVQIYGRRKVSSDAGVREGFLYQVLRGTKKLGDKLPAYLGYEQVHPLYRKIK